MARISLAQRARLPGPPWAREVLAIPGTSAASTEEHHHAHH